MQIVDIWNESLFPSVLDLIIIAVYLIFLLLFAWHYQNKKSIKYPPYEYFTKALFAKIAGGLFLGLIYTLYYKDGGDTTGYFISSKALVNLLSKNPLAFFDILSKGISSNSIYSFTPETGYPMYSGDHSSFIIVRITSLFTIIGLKNYFATTILFSSFFFIGYWKIYLMLNSLYPKYTREFFFAIFLFPSVLFWGSGISKDTVALSATGWFLHAAYFLFVKRKNVLKNSIAFIATLSLLLAVKPYIFVALLPGALIFIGWNYIKRIPNPVVRLISAPALTFIFIAFGLLLLGNFKQQLGVYGSVESIIEKSIITYEDHTRAHQYGHNYYTLGTFDGSLENFISKSPQAIIAGLFRPFLWEIRNPVMLLAALENAAFFIFILVIFWRTGFIKTFRIAFDEPLVIFAISFALVFAFAVGISTANFGALVRLKIPLIPFLAAGLIVLYKRSMEMKNEKT